MSDTDWFSAEQYAQRAHEFYEAGQWDQAVEQLRHAIAINPYQFEWHVGLAMSLDAMTRFDEAITCYEQAIELHGDDINLHMHLGIDLARTGQYQRAIDIFNRVNEIDPECEHAYCHRVETYARLGNHEMAEQTFYLARQLVEHCPRCYHAIGLSLAMRHQFDKAIWCWQQTLIHDPDHPDAPLHLAALHAQRDQHERARQIFLRRLRRDPGDVRVLLQYGRLLQDMDQLQEASEKFNRVLEMEPALPEAHLHLGEIAMAQNHFETAIASFHMALRLDPELNGTHLRLAEIARRREQYALAKRELAMECDLTDHDPGQILDLAATLIELELPQQAIDQLNPLLDPTHNHEPLENDTHAAALLFRGAASMMLGQIDPGILDCRQSLRLLPRNTMAMHNLVVAYTEQSRFRWARYWLHRAASITPDDPWIKQLHRRLRIARLRHFIHRLIPHRR